jgi:hypothetical protein
MGSQDERAFPDPSVVSPEEAPPTSSPAAPSPGQTGEGITPSVKVTFPASTQPFMPGRQYAPATLRQMPSSSCGQLQELTARV